MPDRSYGAILTLLASKHPRVAVTLQAAEARRVKLTSALLDRALLKGIDELLTRLDDLAQAFAADPALAKLAFLIRRGTADFETALEASMSGYVAVAFDAMRDVLEIENLLRDFANQPANFDAWLTADEKTLLKKFTGALAPNSDADKLAREEPAAVQEGWRQTQQMQAVFLALVQGRVRPNTKTESPLDPSTYQGES